MTQLDNPPRTLTQIFQSAFYSPTSKQEQTPVMRQTKNASNLQDKDQASKPQTDKNDSEGNYEGKRKLQNKTIINIFNERSYDTESQGRGQNAI